MTLPNSHQADQAVTEKIGLFCDLKEHHPSLLNPRRFANNREPTLDEIQDNFYTILNIRFFNDCNAMAKAEKKKKTAKSKVGAIPKAITPLLPFS